jgi:hypothetical protein
MGKGKGKGRGWGVYLVVRELELRASGLVLHHPVLGIFEIESCELFAQAGFEPPSS